MSPLRVLHLLNCFASASITQLVFWTVQNLPGPEFEWHIGGLAQQDDRQDAFRSLGAQVVEFWQAGKRPGDQIRAVRAYVRSEQIQVIHTHTMRSLLIAWMARAGLSPAEKRGTALVSTRHTFTRPGDRPWGGFYALVDRATLALPDFNVAVSRTMASQIGGFLPFRRKSVVAVPNAICPLEPLDETQREAAHRDLGIAAGDLVIGWTGRVEPVKRLDVLLAAVAQAAERFPTLKLAVAGEGTSLPDLKRLATRLGIESRVVWAGFRRDIPCFLAAADFFVQTSANEGLSLSILEAMSAGLAVAATRVGSAEEIIRDGLDGLLIPAPRTSPVRDAIERLAGDPVLRDRLGRSARERVRQEYGVEKMVDGYADLYRRSAGLLARRMAGAGHAAAGIHMPDGRGMP